MNVDNGGSRERPAPEGVGVLLGRFLPCYDFQERHSRLIAAPRETVWEAIEAVTLAEMPVVGASSRFARYQPASPADPGSRRSSMSRSSLSFSSRASSGLPRTPGASSSSA